MTKDLSEGFTAMNTSILRIADAIKGTGSSTDDKDAEARANITKLLELLQLNATAASRTSYISFLRTLNAKIMTAFAAHKIVDFAVSFAANYGAARSVASQDSKGDTRLLHRARRCYVKRNYTPDYSSNRRNCVKLSSLRGLTGLDLGGNESEVIPTGRQKDHSQVKGKGKESEAQVEGQGGEKGQRQVERQVAEEGKGDQAGQGQMEGEWKRQGEGNKEGEVDVDGGGEVGSQLNTGSTEGGEEGRAGV